MTTPTTCPTCRQSAHRNARGEILPHTRPAGLRMNRFGIMVPVVEVCDAVRRGARA